MCAILGLTVLLLCAAGLYSLCRYVDSRIDPQSEVFPTNGYQEQTLQEYLE